MKIYIMRGLPGSGKSSWYANRLNNWAVCSADTYHERTGTYQFKKENVQKAHNHCLELFATRLIVSDP